MSSYGVLITGASGMIGKHLIPALIKKGHKIIAVDVKLNTDVLDNSMSGDLLDDEFATDVFKKLLSLKTDKKAVIHLAGIGNVAIAKKNPVFIANTNILLTVKLLSLTQTYGINKFLFPSTGLVYGLGKKNPISEEELTNPMSIYAASKLASESFIKGFSEENNLSSEIFRLSNVYASNSSEDTVVGRIINQARRNMEINVATKAPIRDFIFIDDVVEAIYQLLIVSSQCGCNITNISTGHGTSIGQLVEIVNVILQEKVLKIKNEFNTSDSIVLSNKFIYKRTGWKPEYSIYDGLKKILDSF